MSTWVVDKGVGHAATCIDVGFIIDGVPFIHQPNQGYPVVVYGSATPTHLCVDALLVLSKLSSFFHVVAMRAWA